ncbi:DNA segregation ATPase FtsK/SpoIIIE, S-DNA-T family [Cruoricaptor ignavus]|uniref:DNA segregation ATPase FtsK/SpoIIIE, S-DNA-T family n=1 Tax=Cruoricaptor ignavus TaxID=1118202 RepID=A0A1M6C7S3_9FLAO|nr:DNA translocase FtsK [Cruoricaptor ignavus]SHI57042.1 DNA segregation ATPase FtsK/SpoIIIE, S-DNA-T family [Cruoricaptor ignavus]
MTNTEQQIKNPKTTKSLSKWRISLGLFLLFLSAVLVIAFTSYLLSWRADQSQAGRILDKSVKSSNLFGKVGDWLGNVFIFESLGIAAYIIPFLFIMVGTIVLKKRYFKPWKTIGHSLFFICWLPIFMGAITKGEGVLSGVYGFQIMDFLRSAIGWFGLWMVLLASIALYFILEFNMRPSAIKARWQGISQKLQSQKPDSEEDFISDEEMKDMLHDGNEIQHLEKTENQEVKKENPTFEQIEISLNSKQEISNDEKPQGFETIQTPNRTSFATGNSSDDFPSELSENEGDSSAITLNLNGFGGEIKPAVSSRNSSPKNNLDDIEINVEVAETKDDADEIDIKSKELVEKHGLYDHTLELGNFQMPPIDLLKDYGNEEIHINKDELEENKERIISLLKNFNVGIAQIKATIGPTVTLYEIVPEAGIRVSAIKKLQDDIALNLSALGIRIIAPMPGKGTIGIEVPRQNPTMVSMRSVISSQKFQNTEMDLPVVFGKTISNDIFMADLAKMPHLLMAGTTGMGKSVGINAILTSLLYKKHPSELKFVMIDPKKVELTLYSKIERHYLAKLPDAEDAIITDNQKVINTLNSLCVEMDQRYELLKNAFCRNLKEYNRKFTERKLNPENGHRYLPYIVLVVDEFADLIMTAGKEVEHPIARLAQLARAVGIHLIVATQRPSVNVITGMIKANFPARAAFRVISSVDSRTIIDSPGADQLIGKGDMLYFNGNEITRLQCAFVDTPEVERIVDFIGAQKGYPSAFILPEVPGEETTAGSFDPNERDALFEEAARIIVGTQQGSTSMLQRQLKLGYNRAGRIIDQLEASGIVGSFNGAKAREVLITDLNALENYLETLK